jgi:CRISPR system Cascade subunit CasE
MFLSMLLIDVGSDPDRPRPGRMWLHNLYHVHQRLCMAFPSQQQKESDDPFLKPFAPEQFAQGHVHVRRSGNSGFLFRIDPHPAGRCVVLVLSAFRPDWEYAFHNAQHLLAGPPQTKPFSPQIAIGQHWRFRILCNAVFRARETSKHVGGNVVHDKWIGKRIGISGDEKSLHNWIERRGDAAGFTIREFTLAQAGYVYVNKKRDGDGGQRLRSVRYEGILEVTDAERFQAACFSGIGPAKAFGFGLLSIAPVRRDP